MPDYYLTGHDADDKNSYFIADGDDWVIPPALPGATDRVAIAGMRSGTLNVAVVLGYSGNFNPAPNLDSPASISGGTVTASSAPLGLLIGNSAGHTHATVTINGNVGGDIDVTDGHVEVSSVDGDVSAGEDASVTASSVTGSVSAAGGGRVDVLGDVDASEGSVAASQGTVTAVGDIVTQGFTTGDGGMIQAASIANGGTATMMNYMDGGEVIIDSYNITGQAGSSSRLDILEGAQMRVNNNSFGSGRMAGDHDVVYVNGTGSSLQLAGTLAIGDAGQGSFTVGNHAVVFGLEGLSLGAQKAGKGMISIDGKGSEFDLSGHLVIGGQGHGSLSLGNSGVIAGMDDLAVGVQKSGRGTVSIDGADSGFSDFAGNMLVGDRGHGSLSVTGGAQVSVLEVTAGKRQSGQGTISIGTGAELVGAGTVELGEKGQGTLLMNDAKANLLALVLGVNSGGDGTVDVGSNSDLSVLGDVTIGKNGKGVIAVHDNSSLEGESVTIGSKGKLTVDDVGGASFDHLTRIEKNGVLTVRGDASSAELALVDISGRISVSDNGRIEVAKTMVGDGEITIGKEGFLYLKGVDRGVDIRFAASSKGGALALDHANLMDHAIIKGFAKGDEIQLRDLGGSDALISVARKGVNTAVTIHDEDGHKVGQLTLAGHYTRSALHFDIDTLTTDGPSKRISHADSAAAPADDTFHFTSHAAGDPVNAYASAQYGDGEVETNHVDVFHDYGW